MSENTTPPVDPSLGPDTGHDYDGIRELDNKLPNWWLFTLLGAMVFGYGYWVYYHVLDGQEDRTSMASYQREMAEAEKLADAAARARGAPTDASLLALAKTPSTVEAGKALFAQNCIACHGPAGGGIIGPNLTDDYWIHGGGTPTAIHGVITGGVADKGMPSWGPVLGPDKVEKLTAFVLSIKGTHVPGGKAPQGDPVAAATAAPAQAAN